MLPSSFVKIFRSLKQGVSPNETPSNVELQILEKAIYIMYV